MAINLDPLSPTLSYADRVYEVIREAIVSLQLEPGQEISENNVAASLQVSRSPVRQAFKLLQQSGLVTSIPQRGTFVAKIDPKEVQDACEMRMLIEKWTMGYLKQHGLGPQEPVLEQLINQQEDACARKEYSTFLDLDSAFHETLIAITGNVKAKEIFHQVNLSIIRIRSWALKNLKTLDDGVMEHRTMIRGIKEGNWELADQMVIQAVDLEGILRAMQQRHPEYFQSGNA
jgi:GntR family transcriptional regulator, rspAB operon transcriptional repressor